jgi:hypothetical protein
VSVGTDQLHDFNPGITASGLFWTIPVPSGSVTVHGLSGSASMRAQDLQVEDYFTIANALFGGTPPVPATLSFAVEWAGATDRGAVDDAANDFALHFVTTGATMDWTVDSGGATYRSTGVTGVPFAVVGKERNGTFHE